jgi:hypothetical protein
MFEHLKTTPILLALILLAPVPNHNLHAQGEQSQKPRIVGEPNGFSGNDCETIMSDLDFVAIAAHESGKADTLIIIARLGTGEHSRYLSRLRQRQVADYLNRRLPRERIITAEGERVRGLGQVEFYVGGKLHTIIKVKRNRELARGCYSG